MLRQIYFMGILILPVFAAGCSGLLDSDQPADRIYWLEPLILQPAVAPDGLLPSLVVSVSAAPGLDTDRLLILESDARLNHYAAARWPDNIPDVFESLLRTTLESTGRYSRVTRGASSRSMDWALELEVRELYTLANEPRTVRMLLSGYVTCPAPDHAITIQATVKIDVNRLSDIVAAHQFALHEVSQQLVTKMEVTCQL